MAKTLSEKSTTILKAIADGHSYGQIVEANQNLTYLDIFKAAKEALQLLTMAEKPPAYTAEAVRQTYPNAYTPWEKEDDERLKCLVAAGETVTKIAEAFGRQPSAIRSRISKVTGSPTPDDQVIE
jgi:hypothetical protein